MKTTRKIDFPIERSLDDQTTRRASVSIVCGPFTSLSASRPFDHLIAFGALFVFARMLQQETVQARLVVNDSVGPPVLVAAHFTAEATLAAALTTLQIGLDNESEEIDLIILGQAGDEAGYGHILRFARSSDTLQLSLAFDAARLTELSARDFLEKISLVLNRLDSAPDTRCADLVLLTPAAQPLVPDLARDIPISVYEFAPTTFFRVAAENPRSPAITNGTAVYTYAELSNTVSHLANRLIASGLKVGETVAIAGFSSFGMLASLIAVLAAGGVVVTLDEALPPERRKLIAELSQARMRILVRPIGEMHSADANTINTTDWPNLAGLDALPAETPPVMALPPDANAYIFFTSGSTGIPKGVLGTHNALAHFLAWQRSSFPIGRGDNTAQLTALSFDAVLRDILFPLTSGACVHIPRREMLFNARRMLTWMTESRITAMHCVPSLMKAWLQADHGTKPFQALRFIFFAGEPLTDSLLKRLVGAAGPQTRIVNLYGATETVLVKLASCIDRIEPGVQPVGNPLPGTDVVVIRDRQVLCGLWEIGEIAIRTPYRTRGYLGNEALTRQVFVANPFRDDPDDLLYYTGDLGRVRSDGKIDIFGRIDSQIKIRGIRIEPNEIETHLLAYPGIRDAAITTRMTANGEKVLIGLVVPEISVGQEAQADFGADICAFLKRSLPEAMVPNRILALDRIPYLPNGKLDRKSIGEMQLDLQPSEPAAAFGTNLDSKTRQIIAGFEDALGLQVVNLDKSFVGLGGDSLSYIRVSMIVEDQLGWVPPGWERMSLAELARLANATASVPAKSWWTRMDTTMLFRAIAIFMVTLSHTRADLLISATSTLFVISGMNFSKFLRPGIRDTGDLGPTLRFIARFAIPAGLWQAARGLALHQLWIPDVLLAGTFFQNPNAAHVTFWFLDVMAANILFLAVIAAVGASLARGRTVDEQYLFRSDLVCCLAGLVVAYAQVSSGWWDGPLGVVSVAPFKWFWMLALGVLMTQATTATRKGIVTILLGCLALAEYCHLPHVGPALDQADLFVFASILGLLWIERVPVPRFLQRPIMGIASATLFIYIVNYSVINKVMPALGLPAWWPVQVGVAILVGIVTKLFWDGAAAWNDKLFSRRSWRISTPAGLTSGLKSSA